jgi:hypothetical protein
MNFLEQALSWFTLAFLVLLCTLVFARTTQRILPLFTVYVSVLLVSMVVVWLTYEFLGINSLAAYYVYWWSVLLNASARSLAIVELCRYGLRAYQGIWALIWRVLSALSLFLLAHAIFDAWGQPDRFAIYGMTLDRDLAFASIVILTVLLLFRNYYGITLEPLQRAIAVGVCIVCAVDVVGNTILRNLFTGYLSSWLSSSQKALWPALAPQVQLVRDVWSTVHLFSFMFSIGIWCFALRKTLPEPSKAPVLFPADVYGELSPAINLRLATFNDRMVELLKP